MVELVQTLYGKKVLIHHSTHGVVSGPVGVLNYNLDHGQPRVRPQIGGGGGGVPLSDNQGMHWFGTR